MSLTKNVTYYSTDSSVQITVEHRFADDDVCITNEVTKQTLCITHDEAQTLLEALEDALS